jgi:hypothetical protein
VGLFRLTALQTMKYIFIVLVAILLFSFLTVNGERAEIEPPEQIKTYQLGDTIPEEVIDELIARYATGTKAYQMKRTLYCESGYKNIQSNIVKNGIREPSYGIAQIHQPSHPTVTREQALNPEFAIKFMSDNWGKVAWYGYIKSTDSCNQIY